MGSRGSLKCYPCIYAIIQDFNGTDGSGMVMVPLGMLFTTYGAGPSVLFSQSVFQSFAFSRIGDSTRLWPGESFERSPRVPVYH